MAAPLSSGADVQNDSLLKQFRSYFKSRCGDIRPIWKQALVERHPPRRPLGLLLADRFPRRRVEAADTESHAPWKYDVAGDR